MTKQEAIEAIENELIVTHGRTGFITLPPADKVICQRVRDGKVISFNIKDLFQVALACPEQVKLLEKDDAWRDFITSCPKIREKALFLVELWKGGSIHSTEEVESEFAGFSSFDDSPMIIRVFTHGVDVKIKGWKPLNQ